MISIEEARERILAHVERLEAEDRPVLDALGQALAEDVVARFDIPPLDNTSMDGYAVHAADTAGASPQAPRLLRVTGELAAGYITNTPVPPGSALRIMTGAPIPPGADSVVPFEETDESALLPPGSNGPLPTQVRIDKAAAPGANIRRRGEDVRAGTVILRAGDVIRPAEAGVLASLGQSTARVVRRPIVAILSTGDEVVPPGQPPQPGQIYDSNASSIAALVRSYGGVPRLLGIARDTIKDLTAKLRRGLDADMLVTSAGVSRGDYDIVKDVLAKEGDVAFWTVAIKPGKPLAFGSFPGERRRIPHIGLPGNPVSSMVAFELFGRPAIFRMMGKAGWERPRLRAITKDGIVNQDDPRTFFARCRVQEENGRWVARLSGAQGSGILTSMAFANALAVIPADVDIVEPGEEIEVMMIDWSNGG